MPLGAEGLDILSNDSFLATPALGRASLGALSLAGDAPRVAVLLDVRHALLERVAALGAEEVAKVPVLTEGDDVVTENGRLAVLALRRKVLVPVEVAEEPHALVAVLGHGLPGLLLEDLACCAAAYAVETGSIEVIWLRTDFEGF
ncbi:hypothetical protein RRF57_010446 [Xylaria bambusicola]|uniref:Uncharacterized protein n=1 Tax=Xylaria bambusicola TaxID=326684 RepID=A0AAN7ZD03_9PEZI